MLQARHPESVHLVHEEQLGQVARPSASLGMLMDGLGDRIFSPLQPSGFPREPIMFDEVLIALLVELPLRVGDHRPRFRTDRLEHQRVHPPARRGDVVLDLPRGVHDRRGVENAAIARHLVGPKDPAIGVRVGERDPVPIGIVTGRERLADSRGSIAEPNVAVAAARIAELDEAPILPRLDKRGLRGASH